MGSEWTSRKRKLDSACWIFSGVMAAFFGITDPSIDGPVVFVLGGIAATIYGLYIFLSHGSYWTNTLIYLIPFIVLAVKFS